MTAPAHSLPDQTGSATRFVLRLLAGALVRFRGRTALALLLVLLAKLATVAVPLALKAVVDAFSGTSPLLVVPVFLLLGYAILRFLGTLFGEIRDLVFARVTQSSVSGFLLQAFEHLHRLSVRFHALRHTGGVTRDVERGTTGIGFLLGVALFTVLPTLVEIAAVVGIMSLNYSLWFTAIILLTFVVYGIFTVAYTARRAIYQRALNSLDSSANSRLVDSLLNYETVKYYTNEGFEQRRFRGILGEWIEVGVANQRALFLLHVGQSALIGCGVAGIMLLAGRNVVNGGMTVGDLVLVNAYVIQVCLPLNSLGFVFRQARDAVVNAERLFRLLGEKPEVTDTALAPPLAVTAGEVRFEHVDFGYEPGRQILWDVSFTLPPGGTLAVVGGSGSGKSTLARLLFRFYDATGGRVLIDGQDVRQVTQESLRAAIGIVPQDTILFNDTIAYNIAYGRSGATDDEVEAVARAAHVHDFIAALPEGYRTLVGERGVKLSGGEKQRIAIARAMLKNPPIMVFDEATSALDTRAERAIQDELDRLAQTRTTLVIAHRLSTVVDADEILVLEHGRVVERGRHDALLAQGGVYAQMWQLQRQQQALAATESGLALQPVNLVALLAHAMDGLKGAIEARRVSVYSAIAGESARLIGDPGRLQHILWMLIERAVAASPPGGRLALRVEVIAGRVRLSLGHGGSASLLSAQPDEPPGRPDARALHALIAQHGGQIEERDWPDGSRGVALEFPLSAGLSVAPSQGRRRSDIAGESPASVTARLSGRRILVVDPQASGRREVESLLRELGIQVQAQPTAGAALDWLRRTPGSEWPDLLLCDIAHAGDTGFELIDQVRQLEADRGLALGDRLPAVAIGGTARGGQRMQALLAGFQGHLVRPLTPDALTRQLGSLLGEGEERAA